MRRFLFVLVLLAALPALAGPQWTLDGLRLGMTQQEVVGVLGPPDWEDQTVDWVGDPITELRYYRKRVPPAPEASAVRSETDLNVTLDAHGRVQFVEGLVLNRDGQPLVRLGDRRQQVLEVLGDPERHEPESETPGLQCIGDDLYPMVLVRYCGGRVFELVMKGDCGCGCSKVENQTPEVLAWRTALKEAQELPLEAQREALERVLVRARAIAPEGNEVADTLYWLAFVRTGLGRNANARRSADLLEQALAIYRRVLPGRHGKLVNVLENLAGTWEGVDDEKALRALLEARRVAELRDPDSHETAIVLSRTVRLLRDMSRADEADRLALEAKPIWDKHGFTNEKPFGHRATEFLIRMSETEAAPEP